MDSTCAAAFTKKPALLQNRDDSLLTILREHGELDEVRPDIEDSISRIPLGKDNLLLGGRQNGSSLADFSEIDLGVEPRRVVCAPSVNLPLKRGTEPI